MKTLAARSLPILVLTCCLCRGAAPAVPPSAPEQCEWIVTFQSKGRPDGAKSRREENEETAGEAGSAPNGAPSADLISRQVGKNGNTFRILDTFKDGSTEESWLVNGVYIYEIRGQSGVYMLTPEAMAAPMGPPPRHPMARGRDFPELAWMQPKHFSGEQTVKETNLRFYQFKRPLEAKTASEVDPTAPLGFAAATKPRPGRTETVKAWINTATGLPVRFEDSKTIVSWKFLAEPDIPTTVPDKFQKRLASYLEYKNGLKRHEMKVR